MSNQQWWSYTLKSVSNVPCAFTIFMAAVTLSLYTIFGAQQHFNIELKHRKYQDPESYYVAYPHKYHFVLDQPEKCRHNPFLVIIVPVAPNDVVERNSIRNTWGTEKLIKEQYVVLLFLLGLPSGKNAKILQARIHQENVRHGDLIQSNFIDSSNNATIKTMVMLEWLKDRCPQAHYAAKVDSDVLLNIRSLLSMLVSPGIPDKNYLTGQVHYNTAAIKNPLNRFKIHPDMRSKSIYPPYPLGKCYIMSMDMPVKILEASMEIEPILKDDLYIGLCLEWLNIAPMEPAVPSRFVLVSPPQYERCIYSELIAVIIFSPSQLVSLWTDISKPGQPCLSMG